jgi:hypothetical protein
MKLCVFYFTCVFNETQGKRFLSECSVVAPLFVNSLLLSCATLSVIKCIQGELMNYWPDHLC